MAVLTISQLKTRFQNRDKPDQADYNDLIDTLLALIPRSASPTILPGSQDPSILVAGEQNQVLTTVLDTGILTAEWADLPTQDTGFLPGDIINSGVFRGVQYPGAPATAKRLLCQGQLIDPGTYPELCAVLGTLYGPISSGQYRMPDFRNVYMVGMGPGLTFGTRSGSSSTSFMMKTSQLPKHGHLIPFADNTPSGYYSVGDRTSGLPASPGIASEAGVPSPFWLAADSLHIVYPSGGGVTYKYIPTLDYMPKFWSGPREGGALMLWNNVDEWRALFYDYWGQGQQPINLAVQPPSLPVYVYMFTGR